MSGSEPTELNRKKYVPHLPTLLAICEANYVRLMRMLVDCNEHDQCFRFQLESGLEYVVELVESSRYTTTLNIAQQAENVPTYLQPKMQVRLYHDAKLAEVLNAQNMGAIRPSYQYPNRKMHQKNEKEMTNRFLSEWLSFCIDQTLVS